MNNIFNMFGPSPIRPLEQHMHKVHCCAKLLKPFFKAVIEDDWEKAKQLHCQINILEKEADDMKKDLRLHLPSGLFLPVPRTDLLSLLHYQDKIANKAKDIAGLVMGRKMVIPETIKPLLPNFVRLCTDASRQACKAINELDELLESGFGGNEVGIVDEMIVTLDEIEHQSDQALATIREEIFSLEDGLPPIHAIFLYKVVERLGDLADRAQTVGGQLQILLAR